MQAFKRVIVPVCLFIAVTVGMVGSKEALAVNHVKFNCAVSLVSWQDAAGSSVAPVLTYTCANDSTVYGTGVGAGTCGPIASPTVDDLKAWLSILQSALLSGKQVDFQYDTSCTTGYYGAQVGLYVKMH